MQEEARKYNDILMFDFIEGYGFNLTVKLLATLDWLVTTYQTELIVKTDDDTLVNMHTAHDILLSHYKAHGGQNKSKYILGRIFYNSKPVRDHGHKWEVTVKEYPGNKYPPFPSGPSFALTRSGIQVLLRQAEKVKVISRDDVALAILAASAPKEVMLINLPIWMGFISGHNSQQSLSAYKRFAALHADGLDIKAGHELWRKFTTK